MAFAPGYTAEEGKIVADAYANSPQIRELESREKELHKKYMDYMRNFQLVAGQSRFVPLADTQLSIQNAGQKTLEARTEKISCRRAQTC